MRAIFTVFCININSYQTWQRSSSNYVRWASQQTVGIANYHLLVFRASRVWNSAPLPLCGQDTSSWWGGTCGRRRAISCNHPGCRTLRALPDRTRISTIWVEQKCTGEFRRCYRLQQWFLTGGTRTTWGYEEPKQGVRSTKVFRDTRSGNLNQILLNIHRDSP